MSNSRVRRITVKYLKSVLTKCYCDYEYILTLSGFEKEESLDFSMISQLFVQYESKVRMNNLKKISH